MEARGGGSILMLTSSSVKNPIPNLGLSNVIRPSVSALVKTLADELAAKKIRVNQLVPGRIATERLTYLDDANAKRAGITLEEQRKRSAGAIPLGRYGRAGRIRAGRGVPVERRGGLYYRRHAASGWRRDTVDRIGARTGREACPTYSFWPMDLAWVNRYR